MGERLFIGMDPLTVRIGNPNIFGLQCDGDGLWLFSIWPSPTSMWYPERRFVFRLRPSSAKATEGKQVS